MFPQQLVNTFYVELTPVRVDKENKIYDFLRAVQQDVRISLLDLTFGQPPQISDLFTNFQVHITNLRDKGSQPFYISVLLIFLLVISLKLSGQCRKCASDCCSYKEMKFSRRNSNDKPLEAHTICILGGYAEKMDLRDTSRFIESILRIRKLSDEEKTFLNELESGTKKELPSLCSLLRSQLILSCCRTYRNKGTTECVKSDRDPTDRRDWVIMAFLGRKEAEDFLQYSQVGSFVIRISESNPRCLSISYVEYDSNSNCTLLSHLCLEIDQFGKFVFADHRDKLKKRTYDGLASFLEYNKYLTTLNGVHEVSEGLKSSLRSKEEETTHRKRKIENKEGSERSTKRSKVSRQTDTTAVDESDCAVPGK